jgi:hypothetical protein
MCHAPLSYGGCLMNAVINDSLPEVFPTLTDWSS